MSIIITITTHDGIVMAADSRLTYENSSRYIDNSKKIFLTYENIGIGFTGNTIKPNNINKVDLRSKIINSIENIYKPKKYGLEQIYNHFLKIYQQSDLSDFKTHLYIAGYEDNVPTIYNISTFDNIETEKLTGYFITSSYAEGVTEFIDDIFKEYDEEKVKSLGVNNAIVLSEEWIKEASLLDGYIGGPIDILLIKPNKARWIRDKNGRHKLLSQRIPFNIF